MSIALGKPEVDGLREVVQALRDWQQDGMPVQLHPGDLGWQWRFGAAATAAAVRTWSRNRDLLAVGMLDGPKLLRLAIAPDAGDDDKLARQLLADVSDPERGVLPSGGACMEARFGDALGELLVDAGWVTGEPWTPLARALAEPVPDSGLRIEVTGPARTDERVAVQLAAFSRSTFTADRWQAMAAGLPYADARCLVGFDGNGAAVAAVTVWSAGPGRPGLLEPLGVHREHRGHGHGRAITLAAAAALRGLGSSSATVCTPSSNVGGIATYRSAGFEELPAVRDLARPA